MQSKVTVNEDPVKYPSLWESNEGIIVLFIEPSNGFIVGFTSDYMCSDANNGRDHVGDYDESWDMDLFHRLPKGSTVLLTQD